MSWTDRLKEAAYTPPSGERIVFFYEDVTRETDKKTSVFTFPGKDGAYVQDLGRGGRRYPLKIFFWGENYDTEAQAFYDALEERGGGVLEHPAYGRKNVVPTGSIRQVDQLKTAGNQAVIEVTFWESIIDLAFPVADSSAEQAVDDALADYEEKAPAEFDEALDVTSSSEEVGAIDAAKARLKAVRGALNKVAAVTADVKRQFDAAYDAVMDNMNALIGAPLLLATEINTLVGMPGRALALIEDKLDAYGNIIDSMTGNSPQPSHDNQPQNDLAITDLIAKAAQMAIIEAVTEAEFEAKPDAISAAEVTLGRFAQVRDWGDTNRATLGVIDTGDTYQAMLDGTSIAAGKLVDLSFTLLQEHVFILQAPRTIIDLTAELYGEVDAKLDFFISSNALVGTEILEVPRGRELRYYE